MTDPSKGPLDDHTLPAFDDDDDDRAPESPTESVARELITQLIEARRDRSTSAFEHQLGDDAADPTVAVKPVHVKKPGPPSVSLEVAIDAADAPTKQVDRVVLDSDERGTAISLALGDNTSEGLARLHARATHAPRAEDFGDDFSDVTSPGLVPVAKTGADALKEKRGDIAQLLASIAPFLWSLEAAEKWVRDHAAGDAEGEAHARSLALLARVLGQLQARIDEAAKQVK